MGFSQDQSEDIITVLRDNFSDSDIDRFINLSSFIIESYLARKNTVTSSNLITSVKIMQKNITKLSTLLGKAVAGKEPIVDFGPINLKLAQTVAELENDGFNELRGNILLEAQHAKFSLNKLDSLLREYTDSAAPVTINGRPRADSDNFTQNILQCYELCFPVNVTVNDDTFYNLMSVLLEVCGLSGDASSRIQHAIEKTSAKK